MNVFISWSGDRSKHVAITLRDWLPLVLQAVKPWISVDIEKGQKWNDQLSIALKESKVCILCLTKDNLKSQYLHYEAGAISANNDSRNCTFLFDVKEKDVTNPLSAFQNTKFEKEDIYKLISDINGMLGNADEVNLKENLLRKNFDLHWPALQEDLRKIPNVLNNIPERTDDDVLGEILTIVRNLQKNQSKEIRKTSEEDMLDQLRAKFKKSTPLTLNDEQLTSNIIAIANARKISYSTLTAHSQQIYQALRDSFVNYDIPYGPFLDSLKHLESFSDIL